MNANLMSQDTVAFDQQTPALVIIDQTLLPGELKLLSLTRQEDIFDAIYHLKVRGAPAIGVAAAIGIFLAAHEIAEQEQEFPSFYARFEQARDYLASSRPTAVNLFWALDRMDRVVKQHQEKPLSDIVARLRQEASDILKEDIQVCQKIGEHGLSLIKNGDGILTHCNAGQLATVRYGTALAPIHLGVERGLSFRVFVDETRPLLQGARLTASELVASGVHTTLICDNMASQVMKNGWVQAIFVGCDRVSANGDAANKIGTSGVAILAHHYGIPFYVCAPTSTIDLALKDGSQIPIEERAAQEVTDMWYERPMAPKGVQVYNPAFDVTDHALITAFVTEFGVVRPPFDQGFQQIFAQKQARG